MFRIRRREFGGDGPEGRDQRQIFAIGRELEVRVQAPGHVGAILFRSEHDQMLVGLNGHIGKLPLGEIRRIVGKKPSVQTGRSRGGVEDFNPIGTLAVLVVQGPIIIRHELGDENTRGR